MLLPVHVYVQLATSTSCHSSGSDGYAAYTAVHMVQGRDIIPSHDDCSSTSSSSSRIYYFDREGPTDVAVLLQGTLSHFPQNHGIKAQVPGQAFSLFRLLFETIRAVNHVQYCCILYCGTCGPLLSERLCCTGTMYQGVVKYDSLLCTYQGVLLPGTEALVPVRTNRPALSTKLIII